MFKSFRDHFLAFKWFDGLPMFITILLISSFVIFTDGYFIVSSLVLGTIAAATVDVKDNFLKRLKQYSFALISFTSSAFLVYLSSGSWFILTSIFAIYSFIWLILGSISKEIEKLGTASLLFYSYCIFIFFALNQDVIHKVAFLGFILTGSFLYMIFSLLVYLIYPSRSSHIYLSNIYQSLGKLLSAKSDFFDPDQVDNLQVIREKYNRIRHELSNVFDEAKTVYLNRLGRNINYSTDQIRYYYIAESMSHSLDLYYINYAKLAHVFKHQDILFRFQRLYAIMSRDVQEIAKNIQNFEASNTNPKREKLLKILENSINKYRQIILKRQTTSLELFEIEKLFNDTSAIARKLNKLTTMSAAELSASESFEQNPIIDTYKIHVTKSDFIPIIIQKFKILFSNFNTKSGFFRNAVRVTGVIVVTSNLYYFTNVSFTMWAVMAGVLVSKTNYIATKTQIRRRIFGALMGNTAGVVLLLLHPPATALLVLLVIAITIYAYCRLNSMISISIGLITFVIFLSLELNNYQLSLELISSRFIGNLFGIMTALAATLYLLPNWNYENTENSIQKAYKTLASYFRHIVKDAVAQADSGETCVIITKKGIPRQYKKYADAYNANISLHNKVHQMAQDPTHYANILPAFTKFTVSHDNLLHMINILSSYLHRFPHSNCERGQAYLEKIDKLTYLMHHLNSYPEKYTNDLLQSIIIAYTDSHNLFNSKNSETNEANQFNQDEINFSLLENNIYVIAENIQNYINSYRTAITATALNHLKNEQEKQKLLEEKSIQ